MISVILENLRQITLSSKLDLVGFSNPHLRPLALLNRQTDVMG